MTGLLYKDYKAIKGEIYIIALTSISLLLVILRVFCHNLEIDVLVASFVMIVPLFLLGLVINGIEIGIVSADEGKNAKIYLLSLPISEKHYIASKYWFLLIAYYIVLSLSQLWAITYVIQSVESTMYEMVRNVATLIPTIICFFIIITAIELPFFILFGSGKGKFVKNGIALAMMFMVIVFLLFGDLTLLELLNLEVLFAYLEEHTEILLWLQIIMPGISLVIYYCSYRITCNVFARRELYYEA